jgi:alpha-tubulin suppressor-like RCC1 family protein
MKQRGVNVRWSAVSVGSINSSNGFNSAYGASYCAELSTGGVECWGNNYDGELGIGSVGGPDGPGNGGYDTAQVVTGITNAVSVTSDGEGYCTVLSTGGVDCWGSDYDGELGDGNAIDADTPQSVLGVNDAVSVVSNSPDYGGISYCAVLSAGGVDCWGYNGTGELGNGTSGGPVASGGYDTPRRSLASRTLCQ